MSDLPILEIVESVDSTSDALRRRAESEHVGEFALMARRQTGGRGRSGRRWETVEGNLFLSVLVRPGALRWPGHWSLLAGVAVAEAVGGCLPDGVEVRLKWPNDVMIGAGKVAGVLAEAGTGGAPWLVLGFGVNLAGAPRGLGRATGAVAEHGPAPEAEAFARGLLAILAAWRARYAAEGFGAVRAAWLARSASVGEALEARVGAERIAGRFAGIADSGALLLDTAGGLVAIVAGELA